MTSECLQFGDLLCDGGGEYAEEPCMEYSRFCVTRSDGDESFGPAEACDEHLADAVAGIVSGETDISAVVTIRWGEVPE